MNKLISSLSRYQNLFDITAVILVVTLVTFIPNIADAAIPSKDTDPIGFALCKIYNMFQGTTAKVIASVAVIFLAVGLFVGKITWGVAVATGIGIAAMFGAPAIVDLVSGQGSKLDCGATTNAQQIFEYLKITSNNFSA